MTNRTYTRNKPAIGIFIASRLIEQGKSQKSLAEDMKISKCYLNCIISGRARPTLKMIGKIAEHLSVDAETLVKLLIKGEMGGDGVVLAEN
jgi:transcriptional regulator with XRE-family HTH domain